MKATHYRKLKKRLEATDNQLTSAKILLANALRYPDDEKVKSKIESFLL